jgi:PKD repeat protein
MRTSPLRWLAGFVCFGLLVLMVVPAWAAPPAQGAPFRQGSWLSFDGISGPAEPELTLLDADATAIDLTADLPGCLVEELKAEDQVYSRLYGEAYGHPASIGLPDLPVLRGDVEVPFGATIALEVVSAEYADYTLAELGLSPIYPLQPPAPKCTDGPTTALFAIDRSFYTDRSRYPDTPLVLGETYIVRGHRVQPVEVWPVAYDPLAGTVRLYREITFRLKLTGSDMARTEAMAERYASPAFQSLLSGQLLNYNQGQPATAFPPKAQVGYLIITADAYYDAMEPFVTLRESRGFDVTMTRISEIPGGGSNTAIKAYIQDAYDTWPIPPSYVLLVGDSDTMPGWDSVSAGEVTDLYYATMDGPDDWHPDIGRGRFPVRSPAQTTIMVNKYLTYANLTGQEPWLKWASFIATCDQWQVAEGTHNYVINTYTEPGGYTGIFPNDPQPGGDKLYCITYDAGTSDVHASLNQGRWVAIYSGHGSHTGWEFYGASNVRNLTNSGMFPFVASHACITCDWEEPEVYGETWVLEEDAGALVFWGSTDSSYWDEDDILERAMFDSLFAEVKAHADVTEMTYYGLAETEDAYPGSARYYWETYNILGDPAVKIFLEPDLPTFTLAVEPAEHEICTSGAVTSTVQIGSILGYSETVTLENSLPPAGVTVTFDPVSAQAPFTSELTLDVADGTPTGDYEIVVTATDYISWTMDAYVNLRVVTGAPDTPVLLSPPDGAVDQPFTPTFEWGETPYAADYNLQVDRSPLFVAPLVDAMGIPETSYAPGATLEGGRCYWWQVQGNNACGTSDWAEPFHFATVALYASFFDDMEAGDALWSHQAAQGTDYWAISTAQSHSPTHAWYVPDDPVVTDSYLWNSDPVSVGPGSTLTFWHRHQFESSFDGAVLEISTNGGGSWTDLGPYITANGYNGTISTCCSNPLGGRQAWVDDLTTWTQVEVDLGSFAGEEAQIRWRIGCDYSVSDIGWYIDDVQITSPLPPDPAPTLLSITPDSGSAYVETPVQIEGSGFVDTPAVKLGDTWLLSVTLVSSTTLDAVVPAGMPGGLYDLTLYNGGDCQEAVLAGAYTVIVQCISPTISLESDSPVVLGEPMHFTATLQAGTPPLTYTWDFGGAGAGSGLDAATPVFTYTEAGSFTAVVTVENECGTDSTAQVVEVLCEEPEVVVTSDSPVLLGEPMAFTATVTGTAPFTYTWDFGGEGSGTGEDTATPVFTYTEVGSFTATVTVENGCGIDTISTAVEVAPACTDVTGVALSLAAPGPVYAGEPVDLLADLMPDDAAKPYSYAVDYGDGTVPVTGTDSLDPLALSYTYDSTGTYTVEIGVWNCAMTEPVTDTIEIGVEARLMHYIYLPIIVKE